MVEPYACAACGTPRHHHGRQYLAGVGVHAWMRPDDWQILARMEIRRAYRLTLKESR